MNWAAVSVSSRTLTSAWIETGLTGSKKKPVSVALSRVRGLKPLVKEWVHEVTGRTLTSAWIETVRFYFTNISQKSHSHECVD